MNNSKLRWKYLFVPYLVITLGSAIGYSFLYWLVVVKFRWIDWDERITHWVLPCIVPIILVWMFLQDRISLFDSRKGRWNYYLNFLLTGCFLAAAPAVAFQYFAEDITGELRVLQTPEEIGQHKPVKYYIIQQHQAAPYENRRQEFLYKESRKSRSQTYLIVIAVPLYGPGKAPPERTRIKPIGTDALAATPAPAIDIREEEENSAVLPTAPIWICWQYETSINKSLSIGERERQRKTFYQQSIDSFYHQQANGFTYLRRPGHNKDRKRIMATVRESPDAKTHTPHLLEAVYEPYGQRYQLSMVTAILVLVIACLLWFMATAFARLDKWEVARFLEEKRQSNAPTFRGYI